jgi:hypothetical protein
MARTVVYAAFAALPGHCSIAESIVNACLNLIIVVNKIRCELKTV